MSPTLALPFLKLQRCEHELAKTGLKDAGDPKPFFVRSSLLLATGEMQPVMLSHYARG
jgi:hypothetical protein